MVIGRVRTVNDNELVLKPQVFLKGPVSSEELHMSKENNLCPQAELKAGDRILVYIFVAARPLWPFINQVYLLTDGHAIRAGEPQRTEAEVVDVIRAVTGQYAVPAASSSEGAGIDWGHTVIPLGAALAVIFVIGLVLMRVWHRIDPS